MNRIFLILLAAVFQLAAIPSLAASLCDTEYRELVEVLRSYNGNEAQRREIISEYHNRRSMLASICSSDKVNDVEERFARITGQPSVGSTYQPRKTVEIATIQIRRPASR